MAAMMDLAFISESSELCESADEGSVFDGSITVMPETPENSIICQARIAEALLLTPIRKAPKPVFRTPIRMSSPLVHTSTPDFRQTRSGARSSRKVEVQLRNTEISRLESPALGINWISMSNLTSVNRSIDAEERPNLGFLLGDSQSQPSTSSTCGASSVSITELVELMARTKLRKRPRSQASPFKLSNKKMAGSDFPSPASPLAHSSCRSPFRLEAKVAPFSAVTFQY